ncbi:hypothetical protein CYY_009518 [Polysphondylium violaceum]|uniref:COPI associated protein n=1 Tax=Polysphondylium violaceum TaxID=133409 RepID=A0A8J4PLG3_9MYCE|nr:hypothetical protein CYY_009518 [Polysphondylium violaceum]
MARTNVSLIFSILGVLGGLFVLAVGIYLFVTGLWHSIIRFVLGCYYLLFGVCIVLFEFIFPSIMVHLFGFYTYYFGKGTLFITMGLLILENNGFFLAAGIIVIAIGIVFCIAHFVFGRPSPLVDRSNGDVHHNRHPNEQDPKHQTA